jgi:hypothetical protein
MDFASQQVLQTGASALNTKLSEVNCSSFRKYFEVSDSRVFAKSLLALVPFYYKDDSMDNSLYNPEMYTPAMAIITLVLFKGFILGISNRFHPEFIGFFFTRTIFFHFIICLLYKTACYFLDVQISIKDLLCVVGYKFLIILFIKIFQLIFLGNLLSLYFYVAYFFFLSRSLKNQIISQNSPKTHLYLLFSIVGVDLFFLFLMS